MIVLRRGHQRHHAFLSTQWAMNEAGFFFSTPVQQEMVFWGGTLFPFATSVVSRDVTPFGNAS
jgi:hypothetical protein